MKTIIFYNKIKNVGAYIQREQSIQYWTGMRSCDDDINTCSLYVFTQAKIDNDSKQDDSWIIFRRLKVDVE